MSSHGKKRGSSSTGSSTPAKRVSFATPLCNTSKAANEETIDIMADRLIKKTYEDIVEELNTDPQWSSRTFQSRIFKAFKNCTREGEKVALEYQRCKKDRVRAEEAFEKSNEKIQDFEQRTYEAEEELREQKDELNAAQTIIERNQYKIGLIEKENEKLKEELMKEKEERKLAEKKLADAKIEAAKHASESESKSAMDGLEEKINCLKEELVKLQSYTSNDVMQGPMWLVKKEIVESIYKNSQDEFESFICNYIEALFQWAELVLPESMLNKNKLAEVNFIIAQYFKFIGEKQKNLYEKMVKKVFEKLRSSYRQKIYSLIKKYGIIGFTPDGSCFFYERQQNGQFNPFSDDKFLHPMQFNSKSDHIYGIPTEYENSDFIMVVENTVNSGIVFYHIDPKSGYKQMVYSNGRTGKKGL
uniref:Uncharacterized protein n=1 Tax=Panagrolaimus davidi TaxID=227884 RepID=A0A914P9X5_9BILA